MKRTKYELEKFENYRESIADKAFDYSDLSDECKRISNHYNKQARKNQMYHVYGMHLYGAMNKKGWYLSKAEKKKIWNQTKKEFENFKPPRKDK